MPSRCIFFFSALRAWSTLLSRTRTCTHPPFKCAQSSALGEWNSGASVDACATLPRSLAEWLAKVHQPRRVRPWRGSRSLSIGKDPRHVSHLAAAADRLGKRPPGMPIVAQARERERRRSRAGFLCSFLGPVGDGGGLALPPGFEAASECRIAQRQNARREQRGVDGARWPDRQRADRNARRHLHNGIERIETRQRL